MAMSEEQKNKLVSLGALQKVAENLKGAANQAAAEAAAEATRALAAEQAIDKKADANAAAIAAINNEESGLLKQAKDHAQGLVNGEQSRAESAEAGLSNRLDTLEGIVGGNAVGALGDVIADVAENAAAIAKLNGGAEEEGSVAKAVAEAVKAEEERAMEVELDHEGRIAANERFVAAHDDTARDARIKALEDDAPVKQAAIEAAQQAADDAQAAADQAQTEVDLVEGRALALEEDVARLDGAVGVEGSVKKQIADAIAEVNQAAETLAGRVAANEEFVNGYAAKEDKIREDFAAADAKVREDFVAADGVALQAAKNYADEKITALVDAAPDAMNTLNELAAAINANKGVYDAYIEAHAEAMAQMKKDLQDEIDTDVAAEAELRANADADLLAAINAKVAQADYEAKMKLVDEKDAAQDGRLATLEGLVVGGEGEGLSKVIADVAANTQAAANAQAAANQAQADVNAVVQRLDAADGLVNKIEANAAAIEAEVKDGGARDLAIEAAVSAHDTEVRAMLAAVINSLGISIDNNELKLTLGTSDYVIKTAALNVATDTDIDEMLAALDSDQGE